MKKATIYIKDKKLTNVKIADSFCSRFMGLMGKSPKNISEMGGLLIKPCSQIHMFFMKTPIDVVYLDNGNKIVKIDCDVPTGVCCKKVKESVAVLELPCGSVQQIGLKQNDKLEVL